MTEATANKPKGEAPIIRGYTRDGQTPAELTLWINTPKEGEVANDKAPDFRGFLQVGKEKIYVSAWAYAGGKSEKEATLGKEYPPFLGVSANIKKADGTFESESLGVVNGMFNTTVNEEKIEVDGSKGLKVIGKLTGTTMLKDGVTVSGYLNGRFAETETVLGLAESMGFKADAVNGFKASIEKDVKKAPAPAM